MRVRVVIAAGLALVAGVVVVLLLLPAQRRAGSDYVPEFGPAAQLRAGASHCEHNQLIPGDTGALNLLVGTYGRPTPRIDVTVTAPGQGVVTRGSLPPGHKQGRVIVPVERVDRSVGSADVCIETGPGGRTVLYGEGQSIRLAWLRPGSESRLSFLPTIAHRLGLAKLNPLGSWLLLLLALVLAAAWFIALRTLVREVGP
jgi:hypothetical protein